MGQLGVLIANETSLHAGGDPPAKYYSSQCVCVGVESNFVLSLHAVSMQDVVLG